jgi:hypothetical protein
VTAYSPTAASTSATIANTAKHRAEDARLPALSRQQLIHRVDVRQGQIGIDREYFLTKLCRQRSGIGASTHKNQCPVPVSQILHIGNIDDGIAIWSVLEAALTNRRCDADDRRPWPSLSGSNVVTQSNPLPNRIFIGKVPGGEMLIDDRHLVARTAVSVLNRPAAQKLDAESIEVSLTDADHRHRRRLLIGRYHTAVDDKLTGIKPQEREAGRCAGGIDRGNRVQLLVDAP